MTIGIQALQDAASRAEIELATARADLKAWEQAKVSHEESIAKLEGQDPRRLLTPPDPQDFQNQVDGLAQAITNQRNREILFVEAHTLQKQIEEARSEADVCGAQAETAKGELRTKASERDALLASTIGALFERASEILPDGVAVFVDTDDDTRVNMGLQFLDRRTHHLALSGGEGQVFGAGLAAALLLGINPEPCILCVELAELDLNNFCALLVALEKAPGQKIVCTCHEEASNFAELRGGWEVIDCDGETLPA